MSLTTQQSWEIYHESCPPSPPTLRALTSLPNSQPTPTYVFDELYKPTNPVTPRLGNPLLEIFPFKLSACMEPQLFPVLLHQVQEQPWLKLVNKKILCPCISVCLLVVCEGLGFRHNSRSGPVPGKHKTSVSRSGSCREEWES